MKYVVLPAKKYQRKPGTAYGMPVVGFRGPKGRFVSYRKGRRLSPIVREKDFLLALAEAVPAPARPRRVRKPVKRAPKPVKRAPRPVSGLPAGWISSAEALARLDMAYPNFETGYKASRFQGFLTDSRRLGRYNKLLFPKPVMMAKTRQITGYNIYVLIRNAKSSPGKFHEDFTLAGATVLWQGSLAEILEKSYDWSEVQGKSIQQAVSHRTKLDELAFMFFDRVGVPLELVAIEPLVKMRREEFARVRQLWQKHSKLVRKYGKKRRARRYRKNW